MTLRQILREADPRVPARSEGRIEGSGRFPFILPHAFFDKTEGLSGVMVFLAGRTVVLGELLTGFHSWGSMMGQLVTDSRLSAADPYSS
jgi:hypothetical protein